MWYKKSCAVGPFPASAYPRQTLSGRGPPGAASAPFHLQYGPGRSTILVGFGTTLTGSWIGS